MVGKDNARPPATKIPATWIFWPIYRILKLSDFSVVKLANAQTFRLSSSEAYELSNF